MEKFLINTDLVSSIGLGTYGLTYNNFIDILPFCIDNKINFIDSASKYDNETDLGKAIKQLSINRDSFLLATKISNKQQNTMSVKKAIFESLKNLKVDYIDYYFIHSPKYTDYRRTWSEMLDAKEKKYVKNVAVSNFTQQQIEELFLETGVYPSILQTLINPFYYPKQLINYCNSRGIILQAYCPLSRMSNDIISSTAVLDMSKKYNKTVAQILLRFLYQNHILSIPSTTNANHLYENANIFDFNIEKKDIELLCGD